MRQMDKGTMGQWDKGTTEPCCTFLAPCSTFLATIRQIRPIRPPIRPLIRPPIIPLIRPIRLPTDWTD